MVGKIIGHMEYYKFNRENKDYESSAGVRKAALLLIALGQERAAEIIKFLPQEEIDKIFLEVSRIKSLDAGDRQEIIEVFLQDIREGKHETIYGDQFARDLLEKVYGNEKAEKIIKKISEKDAKKVFQGIEKIDPETLVNLLKHEHPQIITLILSQTKPTVSARLLSYLPEDLRVEVTMRLAKMQKYDSETILKAANLLNQKIDQYIEKDSYMNAGGVPKVVDILKNLNGFDEKSILENLEKNAPDIAADIKSKLLTFELLIDLNNQEMRLLLDRIEDEQIALALKGAPEDIKSHVMSNMSRNRARDIQYFIEENTPVRILEIETARQEILEQAKRLDRQGNIILRKEKDEWVE